MVNFDNAATTFPKPESVRLAVNAAVIKYGGNPGRSGHDISMNTAKAVYLSREKAAAFFGAEPENIAFTLNCTHALNIAVKGIAKPGSHIIISDMEHNSVYRPVYALSKKGRSYSICPTAEGDILKKLDSLITPKTAAVVFTLGSNVTGRLMPYREIGELCRRRGVCFIADGAQVGGVKDIDLGRDNINILCCAAHKGLYAASGTGLFITDGKYSPTPLMEGGTGSTSIEAEQPDFMPDVMESGTINTVGAVSLGAGIDFIQGIGIDRIYAHETLLCEKLINALRQMKNVTVYRGSGEYLPIVLFNMQGKLPEEICAYLNSCGYALRGGLHCSPLAHKTIGTLPDGAVRFSPSAFNTERETEGLINAIRKLEIRG